MSNQWVIVEIKGQIAEVIMNRPEKRNALNPDLVLELTAAFEALNANAEVRLIVLKSKEGAFCAGADLSYLKSMSQFTHQENIEDSTRLKNLFELIYHSPKITVSQVEGPALAGGCGLAFLADFCFATPSSTFGYTEARIGFIPALVMVYLKEKLNQNQMNEWLLTAQIFSADKAYKDGLVYVVDENIGQKVNEFAAELLKSVSSESTLRIKSMMRNMPSNWNESLVYAAEQNALARKTDDCQKGVSAFLNKEKISW
jgi:methylglutaconyl-CoA hydratase